MNYRDRFINTLAGRSIDRLPNIEWGSYAPCFGYSRWDRYIGKDADPREYFGFDNAGLGPGYEAVPIDWFALPRFPAKRLPSEHGYPRRLDPAFGEIVRELPRDPLHPMEVRIFEDHPVKTRNDWLELKGRF